jgi:hypothetical protein
MISLKNVVVLTLLERHERFTDLGGIIIYERSLRAAREIFLDLRASLLEKEDLAFLQGLCKFGERLYETGAETVYLYCTENEMLERTAARSRPSERNAM